MVQNISSLPVLLPISCGATGAPASLSSCGTTELCVRNMQELQGHCCSNWASHSAQPFYNACTRAPGCNAVAVETATARGARHSAHATLVNHPASDEVSGLGTVRNIQARVRHMRSYCLKLLPRPLGEALEPGTLPLQRVWLAICLHNPHKTQTVAQAHSWGESWREQSPKTCRACVAFQAETRQLKASSSNRCDRNWHRPPHNLKPSAL
jgi:hypothetical protein